MPRSYAISDQAKEGRLAKKQATQDALVAAARRLFADKGYDSTPVTEIGRAAGVSHTLINAYFGGKAGLLAAVVAGTNAPQMTETETILSSDLDATHRLRQLLGAWASADLADRRLLCVLHAASWEWDKVMEAENRAQRQFFLDALAGLVEEMRAAGAASGWVAPADVAEAIWAVYTWGIRQAVHDGLTPDAGVNRIWPQIAAVTGLREDRQ